MLLHLPLNAEAVQVSDLGGLPWHLLVELLYDLEYTDQPYYPEDLEDLRDDLLQLHRFIVEH